MFFLSKKDGNKKQTWNTLEHHVTMFFSWEGFISNELFDLFLIGFRPQFVTQGCYRILRQEWLELLVTS